ncbi:MAG: peptidoglycan-binding domain-containing protein [Novosphingobium sp.]
MRIAAALAVVLAASGAAPPPSAATSPAMGELTEVQPADEPTTAAENTPSEAVTSEPEPPADPEPEPDPEADPQPMAGSDVGGFSRDEGDAAAPSVAQGRISAPLAPPKSRQPAVTAAAAAAAALPAGSGTLDSATVQRIIERLIALHFLASAADAQSQDVVTLAIKDFQSSAGISPTGTLDRDTIGRLTTP